MQVRTDTELELAEIDTMQPIDRALAGMHGDIVIAQCYTGAAPQPRRAAASPHPEPRIMSAPGDIARQAAEVGKAAARDSLAGGAAGSPTKLEAGSDADMRDDVAAAGGAAEDAADASAEGGSVFNTAVDFLMHLHSLRRITCSPLPGSQARAATSAAGEGDSAAAPQPLPRVEIEVLKHASYADVVVALSDKLRAHGVHGCAAACMFTPVATLAHASLSVLPPVR